MGSLTLSCQFFFLHLLLLFHSHNCSKICSPDQSSALFQFKQLFPFENQYSYFSDKNNQSQSRPKMMSWKEDKDCCSWDGVICDMATGHVIGLDLSCSWLYGSIPSNSSLFSLSHLRKLNLAHNDLSLSQISSSFSKLKCLTHLNLSSSFFNGQVPYEISYLSKLVSLDLSWNFKVKIEKPVWQGLTENMTMLKELILDSVNMSAIVLPDSSTNLTSSLASLSLESCLLQGNFPENIFLLPHLELLILPHNYHLMTPMFPKVNWSIPLRFLDLSNCNFSGSIPASLGNLTQLSYLDLSHNQLIGPIPSSISGLRNLDFIDLSSNSLSGIIPSSIGGLRNLSFINLSNNYLSGIIPSSVSGLRNLVFIDLSYNSLSGIIPFTLFTLPSLEQIVLNNNQLTGSIPNMTFELGNLTTILLSSNNLSGSVELNMFTRLQKLEILSLSRNRLSSTTTLIVNSSFPNNHLRLLDLSACNLTEFPMNILRGQDQLQFLDLSENKIHGRIPNWMMDMGKDTLFFLNLSHNFLRGDIEKFKWKNLEFFDLHSNMFQGSLMFPPPLVLFFSVANNKLTGEIPSSFCNLTFIKYLDLSNNSLSGNIPENLGNSLSVLYLQKNNFNGHIPESFAYGSSLTILNLNGNQLEGPLPLSWVNYRSLEVVDVGNNKINDTFPNWLADLPQLHVLILRSNKFHGSIDNYNKKSSFPKLRILDLSHNEFTGLLPTRLFRRLEAMMEGDKYVGNVEYMGQSFGGEYYSITLTLKGTDLVMERILTIFIIIDLSNNQFEGEIPEGVGNLTLLKGLNFSHNHLTGPIPSSLGNLKALESLDLSSNKLVGEIPWQLTSLNFLQVLNLSENQLVGHIPRDNHFDTFPTNSFQGNLGLCGFPLSKECGNDGASEPTPIRLHEEDGTSNMFDWKFAVMGYISGLVIGLSLGYMVFATQRPQWFVKIIERKQLKKVTRIIK